MPQSVGKKFEKAIRDSLDTDRVFYHKLQDSTGTFSGGTQLRFSSKQPYDMFLWDTEAQLFYALEAKTTKNNVFSFEDIHIQGKQPNKMIHKHQIVGLKKMLKYPNTIAGFLFNFRLEEQKVQHTYFQNISDFLVMIERINKKSFNEKDLLLYNPISIDGTLKKVNWTWDITKFLDGIKETKDGV